MRSSACRREPVPRRARAQSGRFRGSSARLPAFADHDRLGNRGVLKALDALRDPSRDLSAESRAIARRNGIEPSDDVQVRWGRESERAARDLDAVAFTVGRNVFLDTDRFRPGTPEGDFVLTHELQHTVEQHGREPEVALLSEAAFRSRLGARPEQAVAIDELFSNATFRLLWDYLGSCPAIPGQDHGPIRLRVTPGLRIGGAERFGGYSPLTRTLEINPTKAEHVQNVQELVDTIVHEVLHAVSDVEADCVAAGGSPSPVGGAGTTAAVTGGLPPLGPTELGPGASNPCNESIDIDLAAQRIVNDVIRENMRATRLGAPTLVLLNELIRSNPAALAAYNACRAPACAISTPALRTAAITRCSMETLGTFMSADALPSRVLFDFDSRAIRPDATMALELVATFMRANPTTHVILEGHADPTGDDIYNERLGLRRAQAVSAFLIGHGVSPTQIDDVTSEGEQMPLSKGPSEHFQDRRVELIFLNAP